MTKGTANGEAGKGRQPTVCVTEKPPPRVLLRSCEAATSRSSCPVTCGPPHTVAERSGARRSRLAQAGGRRRREGGRPQREDPRGRGVFQVVGNAVSSVLGFVQVNHGDSLDWHGPGERTGTPEEEKLCGRKALGIDWTVD